MKGRMRKIAWVGLAGLILLSAGPNRVFAENHSQGDPNVKSSPGHETRFLLDQVEQLGKQKKFQEALVLLQGLEASHPSSGERLKGQKLKAKYEGEIIKSEAMERELARESEKKQKLAEVENYWSAPRPYEKTAEPEKETVGETETDVEKRAGRRIPLIDFEDASLKEAVEFLARAADVNIVIDDQAVSKKEERVTVHLKDIPMIDALHFILKTKKLASRIQGGIIFVTSEQTLGEELEVHVYDVQDLVGKLHDFPAEPFDFGKLSEKKESTK